MSAQLSRVKDYVTKYNLEAELSHAVNLAIKENSDNPFRLIGNYLLTLANDSDHSDNDSDDDDDIIHEHEEVAMRPRGRREQVHAKVAEIPAGWEPPSYEKEPAEGAFLSETMASNRLMKSLAPSDRDQLTRAFKKMHFESGVAIITQGAEGDLFYILDSGLCDISITDKDGSSRSVMKATRGISFGELALLHGAPRAATVTCEEPVTAWGLDMMTFKAILMGKSQQDTTDYKGFLSEVPLLRSLPETDITTLAHSLKEAVYPAGANIICEGDEGNCFFIIRQGSVSCTKVGCGEVSRPLTRGDFFGELALLSSEKRAATVTATEPTTVLVVSRSEFTRLLGPLSTQLAEEAKAARTSTSA